MKRQRSGVLALSAAILSLLLAPFPTLAADPVAADDAYSISEDGSLDVSAPGVLDNDSDPDGDPLTATALSDPTHGTLAFDPDGSFGYQPDANWFGQDSFTYRAEASDGTSSAATVTITVTSVNDPPTGVADAYSTSEDGTINRRQRNQGVLANDTDVEGAIPGAAHRQPAEPRHAGGVRHRRRWLPLYAGRELRRHGHLHVSGDRGRPPFRRDDGDDHDHAGQRPAGGGRRQRFDSRGHAAHLGGHGAHDQRQRRRDGRRGLGRHPSSPVQPMALSSSTRTAHTPIRRRRTTRAPTASRTA